MCTLSELNTTSPCVPWSMPTGCLAMRNSHSNSRKRTMKPWSLSKLLAFIAIVTRFYRAGTDWIDQVQKTDELPYMECKTGCSTDFSVLYAVVSAAIKRAISNRCDSLLVCSGRGNCNKLVNAPGACRYPRGMEGDEIPLSLRNNSDLRARQWR